METKSWVLIFSQLFDIVFGVFLYMGAVLKQEACRVQFSAFNNVT